MPIGYKEVQVSDELLEKYEKEKELAQGWAKYAKFKSWLHYANLKRWQGQGHHVQYLTISSAGGDQIVCTCGLFIEQREVGDLEALSPDVQLRISDLNLDQIQRVKGHRSLDDFKNSTVALIVDFVWEPKVGDYLWSAICQECGEIVVERASSEAKSFVAGHNISCGGDHE